MRLVRCFPEAYSGPIYFHYCFAQTIPDGVPRALKLYDMWRVYDCARSVVIAVKLLIVAVWLFASTYAGLAGYFGTKLFETSSIARASSGAMQYLYGELSFRTRQDLVDFLLDEAASGWFPWLPDLPPDLMPMLTCSSFGIFGASLSLMFVMLRGPSTGERSIVPTLQWRQVFLTPLLGAGIALCTYFLVFLLPTVLTVGPHNIRAETLVALSLVSGLGWQRVYQWVQSQIAKLMA
jgi:hypothetical protein